MRSSRAVPSIVVVLVLVAGAITRADGSTHDVPMPVPAAVVLDPAGCGALTAIGAAGLRAYAHPDGSVGWIAVDSDGSKDTAPNACGTTAYTIAFSTSTATAWACGTPYSGNPSSCAPGGVIESAAFDHGQTTCLAATVNNACNPAHLTSGQLRPTPIRALGRMTRALADHEWNCKGAYPDYTPYGAGTAPVAIAPCADGTAPFIDQLTALVGPSGAPAGFSTISDCAPAAGTTFAPGNYFVDCTTFAVSAGDVTFSGGNIVFRQNVSVNGGHLRINTANPNGDVSTACRRDASLTEACLAESSQRAAFVYLRGNGALTKASAAALTLDHVAVYMDPVNPAGTGRKLDLSFGSGPLTWLAPAQAGSPEPDSEGWFFDKLALWSEATNEHRLGGGSAYDLRGVAFTPGALLNYTMGSDQLLEHAQLIAFRLTVAGPGTLRLAPDPDSTLSVLPEAPDTTIVAEPPSISTSAEATIAFESSRPGATFECALDGASFETCTSPVVHTLPEGAHELLVRAVDPWGQRDPTAAIALWTIDLTAPSIVGSIAPAANTNGWYRSPPTVSFSCSDATSGIASCSDPVTLATDGAGQQVTGTAVDNAGHSSSTTVADIDIDQTGPLLEGAPTTLPDAGGWYSSPVTIAWTSSDALSGIDPATDPEDSVIGSEGTGLTAGTSVADLAGNVTIAISPAVDIDTTAPLTAAAAPGGWNNDAVTVTLDATDNLSGVAETRFRLNGGDFQTGTSLLVDQEGTHLLEYQSLDAAGNVEELRSLEILIDRTSPTITHVQSPEANAAGWNNTDVVVTFICGDSLSGVATCSPPELVSSEGALQMVEGTATDLAGNTATDPATVSIDRTPPDLSVSSDREPNAAGWYDAPITFTFTCSDALSGIASCPTTQVVEEGTDQMAGGVATDAADNEVAVDIAGINVDATPPLLGGTIVTEPAASGWYIGPVTITWSCSDELSGIDGSCPADTVAEAEGGDVSVTESVSDLAGNLTTATVAGLQIDLSPPVTTAATPEPLPSGWFSGPVTVALAATDLASGVASTWYSVDGAEPVAYTSDFSIDDGGIHELSFWSLDVAGNTEEPRTLTIRIDDRPPVIELLERTPAPDGNGWNAGSVTVRWGCSDAETDVAEAIVTVTVDTEGADQTATGVCRDIAGNEAVDPVDGINIDMSGPSVTIGSSIIAIGAITGSSGDALSGTSAVTVTYTNLVLGDENSVTADCVGCDISGTAVVAWTAAVPEVPGIYSVSVIATDHAGNTGTAAVVNEIVLVPAL